MYLQGRYRALQSVAHILRATDWMEASNATMDDAMKIKNFRLTLHHHAREWQWHTQNIDITP